MDFATNLAAEDPHNDSNEFDQYRQRSTQADALRHIPAKTSLKSKNGTDYNQREHFQFNELRKKNLSM